jgi:hypothetical protein
MGIVGAQNGYPNSFQVLVQGGPALWTLIEQAKGVSP